MVSGDSPDDLCPVHSPSGHEWSGALDWHADQVVDDSHGPATIAGPCAAGAFSMRERPSCQAPGLATGDAGSGLASGSMIWAGSTMIRTVPSNRAPSLAKTVKALNSYSPGGGGAMMTL